MEKCVHVKLIKEKIMKLKIIKFIAESFYEIYFTAVKFIKEYYGEESMNRNYVLLISDSYKNVSIIQNSLE